MPIEINGNLYFTQNWDGDFSQKQMFQIKILNDNIRHFII